ncbi:MAG TPA: flagellar basal body P-ring protein FlgI [Spirochaetota bacterium]|nr:flagellar basal body P-ring protein FlgI [Spirochaetota bacterium]
MKALKLLIPVFMMIALSAPAALGQATVKVKDIAFIDGLKENQVFGFGLVMGLQGTGDSQSVLTQSALKNLLKNIGLQEDENIKSKNTAAVLVTGKLEPFVRVGDKITVTVSSIGDAKSLEGGVLVQSPLRGADNAIYAVAQGSLSFDEPARGRKSVKTAARIVNGGIVEREIEPEIIVENGISLVMKNWDFFEADQIIKAISGKYPDAKPDMAKGGKIRLSLPENVAFAEFISTVENIEITPGNRARVLVNEKDGTIVMGGDVRISEAVVSKDGVTIRVEKGKGTEKGPDKASVAHFKASSTVKDLVDSLNYIGASTRDIISILKALKDAGALHAELIVR